MSVNDRPHRERVPCNDCQHPTWHEQLFSKERHHSVETEQGAFSWKSISTMLECRGCDAITLKIETIFEEDNDQLIGFYPARNLEQVSRKRFRNIPFKLDALYREIIDAFNGRNHLLCAGGLRALLEGVCVDRGITKGPDAKGKMRSTLEGKINGLKKIIPSTIAEKLHGFRFIGNDALHELVEPQRKDLALAIEIIEDILNLVYELDYKTARLYKQVRRTESDAPPAEDVSDTPTT